MSKTPATTTNEGDCQTMNTDHDINSELRQNVIYAASHLVWAIEYNGADAAKHIADALDRFDNDVEALRQRALSRHNSVIAPQQGD